MFAASEEFIPRERNKITNSRDSTSRRPSPPSSGDLTPTQLWHERAQRGDVIRMRSKFHSDSPTGVYLFPLDRVPRAAGRTKETNVVCSVGSRARALRIQFGPVDPGTTHTILLIVETGYLVATGRYEATGIVHRPFVAARPPTARAVVSTATRARNACLAPTHQRASITTTAGAPPSPRWSGLIIEPANEYLYRARLYDQRTNVFARCR